jgi:hypothetical protein
MALATLSSFQARSDGGNILLEWKTAKEENLDCFIIQRKTYNGSYIDIKRIEPQGSNSYYSYTDENAYKTSGTVFIYRLKICDKSSAAQYESTGYSQELSVSHNVSSVKRTWGSIKAMFR